MGEWDLDVGVTPCGNWWRHPIFFLKKADDLY